MRKRPKVKKENADRYIITYADLLTLLLAFFVILYALSDPKEEEIEKLGDYFESVFNPKTEQIELTNSSEFAERSVRQPLSENEKNMMQSVKEQSNLRKMKVELDSKIESMKLGEYIKTELEDEGLKITLTNEVLFDSASAKIKNKSGKKLVEEIRKLLINYENPISIEGHTDNVPINNKNYESNWELSTDRALTVLKLLAKDGEVIDPKRLSSTGYGEYSPVESNNSKKGRKSNRRVEIVIERMFMDGMLNE